jgi:hypothetical protein
VHCDSDAAAPCSGVSSLDSGRLFVGGFLFTHIFASGTCSLAHMLKVVGGSLAAERWFVTLPIDLSRVLEREMGSADGKGGRLKREAADRVTTISRHLPGVHAGKQGTQHAQQKYPPTSLNDT